MSEKILVVEDSRAFRNYLYQQLKNSGYEVALAESIAEAKKSWSKRRISCVPYWITAYLTGKTVRSLISS